MNTDSEANIEAQIDQLVDQGVHTYSDAREAVTGIPESAPGTIKHLGSATVASEVEKIDPELMNGGINSSAWAESFKDPVQGEINRKGLANLKAILAEIEQKKK